MSPLTEGAAERTDADPAPHVSVCLATYNGGRYLEDQLRSILDQLAATDEVVVVDDASTDDTLDRVRAFEDPQNRGYVRTFEAALREARGDVLLLCDQDDVWIPGRVAAIVAALDDVDVVATNLATLNGVERIRGPYGQRDWHLRAASSGRHVRNIVSTLAGNRPYYGCAMGVRRDALTTVLPFPPLLTESHDLWIALYGNVARSMRHLELRSVRRRFHDENASPDRPRGPVAVIRSRLMLVRAVIELWRRTHRSRRWGQG
jgi:glycosyltransferase involved in cell wall biosynthesis